jgi:ribonuclease BN (tRNA processing enzyme)
MRLTVLGGCGGWPAAGLACSGYLVEHDGFQLLIDPGYATLPRLLEVLDAAGAVARQAGTGRLLLTHLWPGTDPDEAVRAAAGSYPGEIAVASPGLVAEPGSRGE